MTDLQRYVLSLIKWPVRYVMFFGRVEDASGRPLLNLSSGLLSLCKTEEDGRRVGQLVADAMNAAYAKEEGK